jgi:hypothetical protein
MNASRLILRVSWAALRPPLRRSGHTAMVALLRLLHSALAAVGRTD